MKEELRSKAYDELAIKKKYRIFSRGRKRMRGLLIHFVMEALRLPGTQMWV
ncbi:MAG: hypothetical protein LIP09_06835 [Bacteroidales bacterium]|nr:hypothetical protein [Bacteroidales bacterium]